MRALRRKHRALRACVVQATRRKNRRSDPAAAGVAPEISPRRSLEALAQARDGTLPRPLVFGVHAGGSDAEARRLARATAAVAAADAALGPDDASAEAAESVDSRPAASNDGDIAAAPTARAGHPTARCSSRCLPPGTQRHFTFTPPPHTLVPGQDFPRRQCAAATRPHSIVCFG